MSGEAAFCTLCDWNGPVELILGHLRGQHGIEEEPATWPDGEFVVIDATLEPGDFGATGGAAEDTTG